ncbi:hypothetical protein ZHAS_00012763 [Anopheles sinensis]|uniref:Uncharacterized protein n=1 Tax=Anopheles sinensis TaxID=74873 RepID=A0A084W3R0_ANOSI|nr:hypothetical protein ZHAS_00012763 [Anopheles sinensis]
MDVPTVMGIIKAQPFALLTPGACPASLSTLERLTDVFWCLTKGAVLPPGYGREM